MIVSLKNMQWFNCKVVCFSGQSRSDYRESASVVSQQDLSNLSVGKLILLCCEVSLQNKKLSSCEYEFLRYHFSQSFEL